jgi:tetratricopeptide (TPR) repeat protein
VALADVQLRQGGWSAHRGSAERAAAAARDAQRPDLLARAAILRGHMEVTGTRDRVAADLCEEALAALARERADLRAQVMATLAQHRAVEGDAARARQLLRMALDIARKEGDEALAVVLSHANTTALGSEEVADRLALAEEAVSLAERTGRPLLLASGLDDRATARLELGDLEGYVRDVEALAGVGSAARWWLAQSQAEVHRAILALLQGRFGDVEPHAEAALALAGGDPASVTVYASQLIALRREQGRLGEVLPLMVSTAADNPGIVGFRVGLAMAYVHERDLHAAADVIDGLDDGGFSVLTRDTTWTTSLAMLAEAVSELADARRAETIYQLLASHAGHLVAGSGTVCGGAIDRFLGMLAAAQGRWRTAEAHYEEALDLEGRIGAPPLAARTGYWFARMLLARADVGDRPRAVHLLRTAEETAAQLGMVKVEDDCRLLAEGELAAG